MHNEFTAVIERDGEWSIAYSLEIPGANGQGKTKAEALAGLKDAITLILDDGPQSPQFNQAFPLAGSPAEVLGGARHEE